MMMSNGVKSEAELLELRLEKLARLLDYKNRNFCKKYLSEIIREFFSEKNDNNNSKEDIWAKEKDWIRYKSVGNDVVEIYYVESDNKGVYVVKEIKNLNGTTEKKRDVILDFPIELLEFNRIKEFDNPYYKYNELVYRINIDGKEYTDSIKQIRLLIQKRVIKQPFYSKYGIKFKGYLNVIFRSQERELERKGVKI